MPVQPVDRASPIAPPLPVATEFPRNILLAKDTIGEAPLSPPAFTPSKPQLPLYRAILNAEREYQIGNKLLELNMNHLDRNSLELEEYRIQMAQQIKENAEKMRTADFWDILKKISTCILSAISTVIGISLVSSGAGTFIGGALIASGVLAIANLALTETGVIDRFAKCLAGDDEERRKLYALLIPVSIGLLSGALGVSGIAYAWSSIEFITQTLWITQTAASSSGVLLVLAQSVTKALLIGQTAANFADGVLTMGRGVNKAELKWNETKRLAIQEILTLNAEDTDRALSGVEDFIKQLPWIMKRMRRCLESHIEITNRALQV